MQNEISPGSPGVRQEQLAPVTERLSRAFTDAMRPDDSVQRTPALPAAIYDALTALDNRLAAVLSAGDIRFVRSAWLLAQPAGYRIVRRQDLEALERAGVSPSPLLRPDESVALVRRGDRSVGVLSYASPTRDDPDPTGARVEILRRTLKERPDIEGFFWDFPSLYQSPREADHDAAFKRALGSYCDLFASAIGTTVLQLSELPARPIAYDGVIYLFGLVEGVDEAAIRAALKRFGTIISIDMDASPVVRFSTHAAALAARRAAAELTHITGGVDTLYNERSYDGRRGEAGRDDDDGRCWCILESEASSEVVMRLSVYPKMRDALMVLPPKMLALSSSAPPIPIVLSESRLETRVEDVIRRIELAYVTRSGDKSVVISLYKDYVVRIATSLQMTLALGRSSDLQLGDEHVPPLPQIIVPPAAPLRLAPGQPLIMLSNRDARRVGGEGISRLGVVDATGRRVTLTFAGGDVDLTFDACSQAVLPWQPSCATATFIDDTQTLSRIGKLVGNFNERLGVMDELAASAATITTAEAILKDSEHLTTEQLTLRKPMRQLEGYTRVDLERAVKRVRQCQAASGRGLSTAEPNLQRVVSAFTESNLNALATECWHAHSVVGLRCYAAGQWLTVCINGAWHDAEVMEVEGSAHRVRIADGAASLTLHPWNHAPRELPVDAFEALRSWWVERMRAKHAYIIDALTGRRLDALQQCVAIGMVGASVDGGDVRDLSNWLRTAAPRGGEETASHTCATLLTAPPAAGKTTIISQLVTLALDDAELVPITVKVQLLQAQLLASPEVFAAAWNWIDAYLRLEHEPPIYRFLRQVMASRRVLLLLDGLDEGGQLRTEIERHVVEVLAPQGHVLLVTSRPAGINEVRFAFFRRLSLAPLTEAQQRAALTQRLGLAAADELVAYVQEKLPLNTETGDRVTANPLMLSMVASIYELRRGVGMPSTVADLYAASADAMLRRGGASSLALRRLLQAVFFEAHAAQRRIIEDWMLDVSALSLEDPVALAAIRESSVAAAFQSAGSQRIQLGHFAEVTASGKFNGLRGVVGRIDTLNDQYVIVMPDGEETFALRSHEINSSGMGETDFLVRSMASVGSKAGELREACAALPYETRDALQDMRSRVMRDELPLLSLLQADPMQLQSSHLSFQEYFAARAVCKEGAQLSGTPPWQWTAWWANAVGIGCEMGESFSRGLLRAAGVQGDSLDLAGKLDGDRPTVLKVVSQLMTVLTRLDLSNNVLRADDCCYVAKALAANPAVTALSLGNTRICESSKSRAYTTAGVLALCNALRSNSRLLELNLSANNLGSEGGAEIANLIESTSVLRSLDLSSNKLQAIDEECDFYFVPASLLRTRTGNLPDHHSIRKDLVRRKMRFADAIRACYRKNTLVVSHRWERPDLPDPTGVQMQKLQEHLKAYPDIEWVWVDWSSMPQGYRTPEQQADFRRMLPSINMLYLGCSVLLLVDSTYVGRFWTQFECWLSMQKCTPDGLKTASATDQRWTIECIHLAKPEFDGAKLKATWAGANAQTAYNILMSNDVVVTNQSDKEIQLPKVQNLDVTVRKAFGRLTPAELADAGVSAAAHDIGDDGLDAITKALRVNASIIELNLSDNGFTDAQKSALRSVTTAARIDL